MNWTPRLVCEWLVCAELRGRQRGFLNIVKHTWSPAARKVTTQWNHKMQSDARQRCLLSALLNLFVMFQKPRSSAWRAFAQRVYLSQFYRSWRKKMFVHLERILLVISISMQCEHSRIRIQSRYWPEAQQVLQMRDGLHQASLKERHGDLSSMLTHWVPKKQEESQAAQAECCSSCSAFQREFHKATIGWINAKFGLETS